MLFFTGHFGFWELHAIHHGYAFEPIGVLARALDNPRLNALLESMRGVTGNHCIYRQGAVRRVLKTLAGGHGVAMLIDQHMHSPDAIWVNFFERPAATTSTLAALALRTGAPVVPVFALPLPGGRYQVRLRAAGRAAGGRGPRGHRRVHAALHRRAGDVRAAPSRPVAVDASPLARRAGAGLQGHVPGGAAMNLVVLSPNWLGDAVMALPAIADIRRHFAQARLTVAARASVASLFAMVPGVDAVLTLPGRGGLAALRTWRQDVTALAGGGFDTAVLLPNSWASALVVHRAGIAERWGLATDLRARLLTRSAPKPRGAAHQAGYYQALVSALGIENGPAYARVQVPAGARQPRSPARPYVVLAPGAAYGSAKQWPPDRFAELAVMLARGGQAVVLVGSRADAATCQAIRSRRGRGATPNA